MATILGLIKAIPILDSWLQLLIVAYTNEHIATMKKEDRDAIKTAIDKQDQRDLEKAMGSTKVGLPSGVAGSEIVTSLPGVQ